VGDGKCDPNPFTGKFMDQLTGECGIDGGDCDSRFPVTGEKVDVIASLYPNCNAGIFEALIGNGRCDGLGLNIEECGWDGGDCVQYNEDYPDCDADWPRNIGNGRCSGKVGGYDTLECKYDGGDCTAFREMYIGCLAPRPDWVGDGICNDGLYAKPECKYVGLDCVNVTCQLIAFLSVMPWIQIRLGMVFAMERTISIISTLKYVVLMEAIVLSLMGCIQVAFLKNHLR